MSNFSKKFNTLCTYLGKNNNALYGALTIALSKGILRPTYTMMDHKQDKKSRVYTAFREGTTGAVAFGSYLITNHFVEKMAEPICKKAKIMDKLPQVKSTLSLISVSLTALFLIPMICNAITTPLLNFFTKPKKELPLNKNTEKTSMTYNNPPQAFTQRLTPYNYYNNKFGMKVGL